MLAFRSNYATPHWGRTILSFGVCSSGSLDSELVGLENACGQGLVPDLGVFPVSFVAFSFLLSGEGVFPQPSSLRIIRYAQWFLSVYFFSQLSVELKGNVFMPVHFSVIVSMGPRLRSLTGDRSLKKALTWLWRLFLTRKKGQTFNWVSLPGC